MDEVYVIGDTPPPSCEILRVEKNAIPEVVNCTACNKGLKTAKRKIFTHPRLNVLLCKSCLKFLNTNEFTKDEQGIEEYCTWCGDGGNLVCCDFCEKAYCKHCVKRNLGKEFLKTLLSAPDDSKWKCFYCDNGQIITFVDECKAVIEHVKSMPPPSEGTARPPTKEVVKETVKSTNLKSTSVKPTNKTTAKVTSSSNGISAAALSNSQLERRKRLQEVTKQVENVSSERVGFKSSFPRYEISSDDDDDTASATPVAQQNNAYDETDSKSNILRLSSMMPVRNSIQTVDIDKPPSAIQVPVIDKVTEKDSTTEVVNNLSGNEKSKDDTTNKRKSLSSVLEKLRSDAGEDNTKSSPLINNSNDTSSRRSKKDVNYNEKELQKDAEKDALKSTKKDEEGEAKKEKRKSDATKTSSEKKAKSSGKKSDGKDEEEKKAKSSGKKSDGKDEEEKKAKSSGKKSDGKDEEKSKSSETSKKKKQTILMLSSSEGSDEEIVVMSKSGKRRVISKSLLKLAQAAMENKESKKSRKDDKPHKKEKNRESFKKKKKKKQLSEESSSEDEKSSDDSTSDDEPLSKVRSKNSSKAPKSTPGAEEKSKDNGIDEQQPGPSGVRPKNKLQRSKQVRPRQVFTSDSSDDDNSVQKSGILSKKFRHKEENDESKDIIEEPLVNETQDSEQISDSYNIDLQINNENTNNGKHLSNGVASPSSLKQNTDKNVMEVDQDGSDKKVENEIRIGNKSETDPIIITNDGTESNKGNCSDLSHNVDDLGSELGNKQAAARSKDTDMESSNTENVADIINQVIDDLCDAVVDPDNIKMRNKNAGGTDEKIHPSKNFVTGILKVSTEETTEKDESRLKPDIEINSDSDGAIEVPINLTNGKNVKNTELINLDTSEKETEIDNTGKSNITNTKHDKTSKADIEIDCSDSENETVGEIAEPSKTNEIMTVVEGTGSDECLKNQKIIEADQNRKETTEINTDSDDDTIVKKPEEGKKDDKEGIAEVNSTDSKMKGSDEEKEGATKISSSDSEDESAKKQTKTIENNEKPAEISIADSEDENLSENKINEDTNKEKTTEVNSTDSDNETLIARDKEKKNKEKKTLINATDSEDETLIAKSKKKENKEKTTRISSTDSEDEALIVKSKAKKNKEKKISSTDSDDETLSKKSKATKHIEKKTEISSTDSENETLSKTKNKKKKTETDDVDSDDESPIERRVSKRKKKKVEKNKGKGSDSESSGEVKARRSKRKKANEKDDDSESASPVRRQPKRKKASSDDGSDSDSDVKTKKVSKSKKKRKRIRYNPNANKKSGSSSSNDNDDDDDDDDEDDDDDDDDDVELNNLESDSSSTDGSIIISRKSKRLEGAEKSKKKKVKKIKKKKGGKGKKKGSDEDEDEDEEGEGDETTPSKGGRKKIRTIMKDTELDEETIKAQKAEDERRKRLLERTKAEREEVNIAINVVDGDFILEKNENKDPLVAVLSDINKHLKPHQRKGIQFMYDCLIETVASYKKGDPGGGCLLAHCMGLGKTLQVVSLVHTVMNNSNIKMEKFLVVCPLNTVLNWESEFDKWIPDEPEEEKPYVYVLSYCNGIKDRVGMMKDWFKKGGVLITGYEMYRNLVQGSRMKSKKMKADVKEYLSDPGPDIVVCDEGHILKNEATAISKAMSAIKTKRRVVLTGTPLQNNLLEYHCMVDFVKPKLLGTRKEYQNRFVNPILNGQCSNSTSFDVRVMKQRCHVLYQLLAGCVQRQDYSVLTPFLPQKREYTIFVRLTEKQIKMYEHYLEEFVYRDSSTQKVRSSLFSDFQCLARIWSHPWCLHIDRVKAAFRDRNKHNSDDEFLDDDDEDEKTSSESDNDKQKPWNADTSSDEDEKEQKRRQHRRKADSSDSSDSENGDKEPSEVEPGRSTRSTRSTRATASARSKQNDSKADNKDGESDDEICTVQPNTEVGERGSLRSGVNFKDGSLNPEREEEEDYEKAWFDKFLEKEDEQNVELGGKLVMLLEILANAEAVGDKILVFSQSLTTLDLIEKALTTGMFEGDQLCWIHGVDYFRMDGSTPVSRRKRWADIFNDPENEQCRLFLISTRAGSLGINMVGANRVIVFDCSWNPSHDVQSVFRVYRFGQEKPVYVYRFIAQGTMEEKIYGRQITKLATAGRVVDEQQIGRHFTDEEIRELYTFSPDKIEDSVETPQLPKDPLLAEVLQRLHPKFIVRYHEHDLLLENVEAEELSEEERKLAWKNYEDEKEGAAKRLDFRNFIPPPVTQRYTLPPQFTNANLQQFTDINRFRVVGQAPPGFQRQRYTISYPPEMSVEQRQQALLELRQREVMRLLIQQRNQQTISAGGGSTIISNNHNAADGYRHIRLQNIAPAPAASSLSSSFRYMPGTNISSRPISTNYINNSNVNNATTTNNSPSSVIHTAGTQKSTESHQGGYLAAQKKGRPSHYDIT